MPVGSATGEAVLNDAVGAVDTAWVGAHAGSPRWRHLRPKRRRRRSRRPRSASPLEPVPRPGRAASLQAVRSPRVARASSAVDETQSHENLREEINREKPAMGFLGRIEMSATQGPYVVTLS